MKALVLKDVRLFELREIPKPIPAEKEVLIRIAAVGICGTDLHLYLGLANYNRDSRGQAIPLKRAPQILGHEFCGTVESVGGKVTKVKRGDRVVVDQLLNCLSQERSPLCEYCESGDSHECEFGKQFGVTGIPGAFADYISVPAVNVVPLPADMTDLEAAIIEPLACVLHASDRMEAANNRYTFSGRYKIRHILILGAGPSGLLFVQYLRNIKKFEGEVFVADMRESKLNLAKKLGATPLDVRRVDMISEIQTRTHGERLQYLIEATGSGEVFDWIPSVVRPQATILLYGGGHSGRDIGCLTPFQVMENVLVTSGGASGSFDADGTPTIYRRSMEYLRDRKVDAESLVTHRYSSLAQLPHAFSEDALQQDFIKGVLVCG
ncbi:MAG TPA: alcohol dehydrogenase catalytic domain-containing protein [Terriglobia bacterium]|nr:alcohol dehydrogenase catalytic domain-containing protein [Terriglobia bacterium]